MFRVLNHRGRRDVGRDHSGHGGYRLSNSSQIENPATFYRSTVWCSILAGFLNLFIGAVVMTTVGYYFHSGNAHGAICTIAVSVELCLFNSR